jgi:membrane-anchored glycerophosphoryl diester phosphodiesterase (GDPDase)
MTIDEPITLSTLGVGDILKSGLRVFTSHFWKFAGIQLLFTVPMMLLVIGPVAMGIDTDLIEALTELLIGPLMSGTLIWAVGSAYLRSSMDVKDALRAGFRKYISLFGNMLLVGIIMVIPVIMIGGCLMMALSGSDFGICIAMLLILPVFIYISVRLAFTYQLIIFDGQSAYAAIGRSWDLTDGWAVHIFGVIFLAGLASIVLTLLPIIVVLLFGSLAYNTEAMMIVSVLFGGLVSIFIQPFQSIVTTCVYYDVLTRKEAVPLSILVDQLD